MADGDQTLKVTLKLSEHALRHLKEGASKLGVSVEDYASDVIEQHLFDYDAYDWGDRDPRLSRGESFDPSEPTYPLDETMVGFREALERRLAAKS